MTRKINPGDYVRLTDDAAPGLANPEDTYLIVAEIRFGQHRIFGQSGVEFWAYDYEIERVERPRELQGL